MTGDIKWEDKDREGILGTVGDLVESIASAPVDQADLVFVSRRRVVIIGGPRTGKTTLANSMHTEASGPVRHTDDLIGEFDWSGVSEHVAREWMAAPGPWVIEGVAAVRALRKWLRVHGEGKPCDRVIVLTEPHVELSKGQAAMAKGCAKVWAEIRREVEMRGVAIVEDRVC